MRLAVCALSAVLMSGCSWLGMGGHSGSAYNTSGMYGANCAPGMTQTAAGYGYNTAGYGSAGFAGVGCGGAGGYGVGGSGYGIGAGYGAGSGYGMGAGGAGAAGYGMGSGAYGMGSGAGYGAGTGYGMGAGAMGAGYGAGAGGYGAGGYGAGAGTGFNGAYGMGIYGAGAGTAAGLNGAAGGYGGYGSTVTTLGANAPYGAAVAAPGTVLGTQQYAGGAYGASGAVTTVAGNPIYVPQPYPAYYGVPQMRRVMGGGALPFGLELGLGRDFDVDGDILSGEVAKPSGSLDVSAIDAISYDDAFKNAMTYSAAATYDMNRDTTLLGRIGYTKADGSDPFKVGTVTSGSTTEDLNAEFSDLEQWTIEGGVRQYVGGWSNPVTGFRPYVGATAGAVHTDDITLTQSSTTLVDPTLFTQQYVDGGWQPTASGLVGAEWQVGGRTAVGVETGIRWTDNLNTNLKSSDRWSVPVRLRGRMSF